MVNSNPNVFQAFIIMSPLYTLPSKLSLSFYQYFFMIPNKHYWQVWKDRQCSSRFRLQNCHCLL